MDATQDIDTAILYRLSTRWYRVKTAKHIADILSSLF